MTTFLLLRHASHDWLARGMAGRLPGVGLNERGRAEAAALAAPFAAAGLVAIYSSPRQRARETAAPIAARLGLPVGAAEEFDEIDFGAWMGLSFAELERDVAGWDTWVNRRGSATPPGGEPFAGVPLRARAGIDRLGRAHPQGRVLVVSHGDVIKALLAHTLGLSLDLLERFAIDPASLSVIETGPGWAQVRLVNGTAAGLAPSL